MAEIEIVVDCMTGQQTEVEMTPEQEAAFLAMRETAAQSERVEREAQAMLDSLTAQVNALEETEVMKTQPNVVLLARVSVARRYLDTRQPPPDDLVNLLGVKAAGQPRED